MTYLLLYIIIPRRVHYIIDNITITISLCTDLVPQASILAIQHYSPSRALAHACPRHVSWLPNSTAQRGTSPRTPQVCILATQQYHPAGHQPMHAPIHPTLLTQQDTIPRMPSSLWRDQWIAHPSPADAVHHPRGRMLPRTDSRTCK